MNSIVRLPINTGGLKSYGIKIVPDELGLDPLGNYHFQLAEIEIYE